MEIGVTLPQFGPAALEGDVARFARAAEDAGVTGLWVGDRLLAPVDPAVGYRGGQGYPNQFRTVLDPFVVLAVAAAVTGRVALGTNVLNTPWYPPALLARTAASLDLLSGGRLRLGLGLGWSPEEYAAAGAQMPERGARLDECLDVLDAWWSAPPGEAVSYEGRWTSLAPSYLDGRRPRRFPVLLAAWAPRAMDRLATRADGWLPAVVPGQFDPRQIAASLAEIRSMATAAGRDADAIGATLRINPTPDMGVTAIADAAVAARDEIGIGDVFVELMYSADDVEGMLALVRELVAALDGR